MSTTFWSESREFKNCASCPVKEGDFSRSKECCAFASGELDEKYLEQVEAFNCTEGQLIPELGIKNGIWKSNLAWERALKSIPGGTQTLGKSPIGFIEGVAPKFLIKSLGSRTWDVDGNEYIDCWLACLPITLGHLVPEIDNAIINQLRSGISFSLMTELEYQAAEALAEFVPFAEKVRFAKNGSDVTEAAVRLSRHITGKNHVITMGYHGFHDWYVGSTDRYFGIPEQVSSLTSRAAYNDIANLESLFERLENDVACLIMEPAIFEFPEEDYLRKVKHLVKERGALLVFDEMLTGFRFSSGGAMKFFGVEPDLATFGKGIANGMPIAMIVGPDKFMKHFDKVFFSSTYGGETLSLAAMIAGLEFQKNHDVVRHLWTIGKIVFDECQKIIERTGIQKRVRLVGFPVRQSFSFIGEDGLPDYDLAGVFQQEMLKSGVLCNSGLGFSFAHSLMDARHIVESFRRAAQKMKNVIDSGDVSKYLEGVPAKPVFKGLRDQKITSN